MWCDCPLSPCDTSHGLISRVERLAATGSCSAVAASSFLGADIHPAPRRHNTVAPDDWNHRGLEARKSESVRDFQFLSAET
jgi:hypothetical protein